jgi:2-oxoglutarate dehydrogenase E1 component
MLQKIEKPLIVLTPKSLLRLPAARSQVRDFTEGYYREVMDADVENKDDIKKLLLTSGKVYYDLKSHKDRNNINDTAIIRIEQYYPYNSDQIKEVLKSYPNAKKVYWVQEEPQNMGAWYFLLPRLTKDLAKGQKLDYIGRPESPSPASGSATLYKKSQEDLIEKAFKV